MFKHWGELTLAIAYEGREQIVGVIQWDEWHILGKMPSRSLLPELLECVDKANALDIEEYLKSGKCADMMESILNRGEQDE